MSKLIPLTQGKHALVDDQDYELLSQYKWCFDGRYALRRDYTQGGKAIWMHRLINNTPDGFDTDHVNQNKLDNRRSNLRTATRSLNQLNTGLQRNNKTGVRGVCLVSDGRWRAQYRKRHIGYFGTLREATEAYLATASADALP